MPARGRHEDRNKNSGQRKALTATVLFDALTSETQDAGTWRGNDMAAAATIVARSTRRVHMFASYEMS